MAEKEEVRYYSENKIEVNGKAYNVTFTFPLPENETETAYDKLKHLINGEKVSCHTKKNSASQSAEKCIFYIFFSG